jgi:hypothetical protein
MIKFSNNNNYTCMVWGSHNGVVMNLIFWYLRPCSQQSVVNRRFRGTRCLSSVSKNKPSKKKKSRKKSELLRNVGWLSTDHTTLHPRREYSSRIIQIVITCSEKRQSGSVKNVSSGLDQIKMLRNRSDDPINAHVVLFRTSNQKWKTVRWISLGWVARIRYCIQIRAKVYKDKFT